MSKKKIRLTGAEIQSNHNRQDWAEGLISQLPKEHEGRNSWLLNYGKKEEGKELRKAKGLNFRKKYQACETNN